jgi:hypothetical protein
MDPMQSEKTVTLPLDNVKPSFGRLKNGNPPMDPHLLRESPRCTARRKRDLQPCQNPAVRGFSVCRMHGARGGPKTSEGLERCRKANWRHGQFSKKVKQDQREIRAYVRWYNAEMKSLWREFRALQRAFRREGAVPPPIPVISLLAIDKHRA